VLKASINCKEREFQEGAKFIEVVELIREAKKDEPMIKAIREKTGKDNIVFVLNGRVVHPHEYETLSIQEGDDIRWVHPYFGG
jgi:sulfur carrier protein ThiS